MVEVTRQGEGRGGRQAQDVREVVELRLERGDAEWALPYDPEYDVVMGLADLPSAVSEAEVRRLCREQIEEARFAHFRARAEAGLPVSSRELVWRGGALVSIADGATCRFAVLVARPHDVVPGSVRFGLFDAVGREAVMADVARQLVFDGFQRWPTDRWVTFDGSETFVREIAVCNATPPEVACVSEWSDEGLDAFLACAGRDRWEWVEPR